MKSLYQSGPGMPYAQAVDAAYQLGVMDTGDFREDIMGLKRKGPLWGVELPDDVWVGCWSRKQHANIVARMINKAVEIRERRRHG